MRHTSILTAALAATLVAGCGANGLLPAGERAGDFGASAKSGEVVVKFAGRVSRQARLAIAQEMKLREVDALAEIGVSVYKASGNAQAAAAALSRRPEVAYAEVNGIERVPAPIPGRFKGLGLAQFNDPMMKDQWALGKIDAAGAWAVTTGQKDLVLAIVDTGVDYNHPDLKGRVVAGYDFVNNDDDAMDGHSHGTHCAGIAAASAGNGEGIAGLAPNVAIMPVKVLSDSGSGSTTDVVKGVIWAVDNGAKVVSMSLGGASNPELKQEAIDYAISKDVLVVAAMGNNGREYKVYPGANKGAMGVGATTAEDTRASFSNYGEWISVSAPGHNILSTVPNGGYKSYSGTSMATPYVAGLAALVRGQHPDWTYQQVRTHIEKTSVDVDGNGFDKQFGHGRINAGAALK